MDGLAVGSLYALIALGYTMVYGILKFINFAHSDVFVLGAWISYSAALVAGFADQNLAEPGVQMLPVAPWVMYGIYGLSLATVGVCGWGFARHKSLTDLGRTLLLMSVWGWVTIGLVFAARALKGGGLDVLSGGLILIAAMLACGLVGFALERLAYKPLRKAPRLNVLITAIGISLLLQNTGQLQWMFGTRPQGMPSLLPSGAPLFEAGGIKVWPVDAIAAGTAIVLMLSLDRLVFHSKIGRAMRAVSFSERNAALMGIPVDRVISFTFVLGAMLAAAAGFLYGQKYAKLGQTAEAVWVLLGLKAFVAAVVGGIGNIRGAMLGGILIGLLEFFTRVYVPRGTQLCDVVVFGALVVLLLVKPAGILGTPTLEKV